MRECLTPELIVRYCDGDVDSVEEVRAVDAHLVACAACRDAVRATVSGAATSLAQKLTLTAGESACLSVDWLTNFLKGETDAAESGIVNAHVEVCAHCAENLASLRAFQPQRETDLRMATQVAAPPPSGWARWREWLLVSPQRWFALQTTGVAAVAVATALLIFWTTTRPVQQQVVTLQTQLQQVDKLRAQLRQTNDDLQKQVAAVADLKTLHARLEQENQKAQQDYKMAQSTVTTLQTRLARLEQSKIQNPKSEIILALNDGGGRVTVDKQGNMVRTEPLPSAVKDAVQKQQVKPPVLIAQLMGGQGVLRGDPKKGVPFALHSPISAMVQSDCPTFRWQPLDGATSYTVTVVNEANDRTAAKSDPLTGTEWTVPTPLPRGGIYRWFVTALKDGQEVQSPNKAGVTARFKVLEQKKFEELESAKKKYAHSPLTLGILYAQAGLLDEAEREFQTLLNANPKSPIARKLLKNVRALRQ